MAENITENDYNNAFHFLELFLTYERVIITLKLLKYMELNIPLKETTANTEVEVEEFETKLNHIPDHKNIIKRKG